MRWKLKDDEFEVSLSHKARPSVSKKFKKGKGKIKTKTTIS
jgi:hypothetical protein